MKLDVDLVAAEAGSSIAGDHRLAARHATCLRCLAVDPSASFPQLMNAAELEGLYRFCSNHRVVPEELLAPHVAMTRERCRSAERVLLVHDSTDFSFRPDGARSGLGRHRKSTQTFFGHFSLAIDADGSKLPLGVLGMHTWVRGAEPDGTEVKRWLQQIRSTAHALTLEAQPIHVLDREADDYNLFALLTASDQRFVARACFDRHVEADEIRTRLRSVLLSADVVVDREAQLTKRRKERHPLKLRNHPPREARVATLSISAMRLLLQRPKFSKKRLHLDPSLSDLPETLEINVVRVWEPNPPADCAPVEWILYTNEPISSADEVGAIVDHYRGRWVIEEFFKALKTGCAFEKRQLHDYDALVNALALFVPVAYHLLHIRTVARKEPDAPASRVVDDDQLAVLRALGRRPLSNNPTARDIYLAVAALGGHIKYAPDPGWLTLSRGFTKLDTMTQAWRAAKAAVSSDER